MKPCRLSNEVLINAAFHLRENREDYEALDANRAAKRLSDAVGSRITVNNMQSLARHAGISLSRRKPQRFRKNENRLRRLSQHCADLTDLVLTHLDLSPLDRDRLTRALGELEAMAANKSATNNTERV